MCISKVISMSSKNKFCTFLCISFLDIPRIMCSQPKCDAGCRINYETKPCPSCECSDGKKKYIVSLNYCYSKYMHIPITLVSEN